MPLRGVVVFVFVVVVVVADVASLPKRSIYSPCEKHKDVFSNTGMG